jgi:SPP1 family holin
MNIGTIARTITAAIVAINACLVMFGITIFEDMTEESIYAGVSAAATVVMWAVSHYKNNDYTKEAAEATGLMRLKKQANKVKYAGVEVNGENFFDMVEEGEQDA